MSERFEQRVYSVNDVMAVLNLSRGTVERLYKTGALPSKKLGRRVLIDRQAVDKLLPR